MITDQTTTGEITPVAAPLRLLADLSAQMGGELSVFAEGMVGPDDARPSFAIDRLLDDAMLAGIFAHCDSRLAKPDRRAVVSVWALSYFMAALPPLMAANILLDRTPRIGLSDIVFVAAPDMRIAALKVAAEEPLRRGGRFDGLVLDHLAPFIRHVAERGGVTERLLWSNAGHVFEAFLTKLERAAAARPGYAAARALLMLRRLPNGSVNPLYQPVRYVEGRRIRRICCLRFLVAEWQICAICPLDTSSPARRNCLRPTDRPVP